MNAINTFFFHTAKFSFRKIYLVVYVCVCVRERERERSNSYLLLFLYTSRDRIISGFFFIVSWPGRLVCTYENITFLVGIPILFFPFLLLLLTNEYSSPSCVCVSVKKGMFYDFYLFTPQPFFSTPPQNPKKKKIFFSISRSR